MHITSKVNVDNCANPFGGTQSVIEYTRFHDALVKVGKPMVYAIWAVGFGKPWAWAPRLGHYYRTAGDLGNRWGQVRAFCILIDNNAQCVRLRINLKCQFQSG